MAGNPNGFSRHVTSTARVSPGLAVSAGQQNVLGERVFGRRQVLLGETLGHLKDFVSLRWCKFHERLQQPQALDNFAGWSSKFFVQL